MILHSLPLIGHNLLLVYYTWVQMLLQIGPLLRLGSKCYYGWDFYYAWVQMLLQMGPLLHLGPVITLVPFTEASPLNDKQPIQNTYTSYGLPPNLSTEIHLLQHFTFSRKFKSLGVQLLK